MEKAEKYKELTLLEQGANLPVGILDPASRPVRSIEVRRWRLREEKMLAELVRPGTNMAQYVTSVLATMCTRLGVHDFEGSGMKPEVRSAAVSSMWMADVWYAYVWLRYKSLGKVVKMTLTCAKCGLEYPYQADLETLRVRTIERAEDASWSYELREPIKIRGKQVSKLGFGLQRWAAVETIFGTNSGAAKAAAIAGAIRTINDEKEELVFSENDVDELSKQDFEGIIAQMDEQFVGPNMAIEISRDDRPCPKKCPVEGRVAIDWSYNSFFGSSSR